MAGARKVHLQARVRGPGTGRMIYLPFSACGRYPTSPNVSMAVMREHLRRRLTSAVTCKHCRDRWLKHGEALPPPASRQRAEAAA